MKHTRGTAIVEILVVLAVLSVGAWLFKPKALDGDSRRAKQSTEATAELLEAQRKQGATAAAKITTVSDVAGTLPDSNEKTFIQKETASALGDLPKPDPDERLKSIERKLAVLAGDIQKTNELYAEAHKTSLQLQKDLDKAVAERNEIDAKLTQVAAERLGAERQRNAAILGVVLLGLVAGYLKFFGINRATLGRMAADIRAGEDPIRTFDTHLAPWMHAGVNRASRLATPHDQK